jgi:IS4 transposase
MNALCSYQVDRSRVPVFHLLFVCTLYSVWQLVDLLVKLELLADSEFRHKPLVTADLFLTIAKDYVGLDPPD